MIFTSDNGLLWGEHRWVKKEVPYEEAIRVPLVIRADRIASAAGRTDGHLVANIDLAPTIAAAAGLPLPDADGRSLLPLLEGRPEGWRHALLIEHLRGTNPIPTYCAVRTSRYLFASYETGERELYDLAAGSVRAARTSRATRRHSQSRLEDVLERLCDPPPPGFHDQMGLGATLLAIVVVLAAAAAARSFVSRTPATATGSMSRPMAQVTCPQCQTRQEIDPDAEGYRCLVCAGTWNFVRCTVCVERYHTRPGARAWTCPNCGTPHGRNRRGVSRVGVPLPFLIGGIVVIGAVAFLLIRSLGSEDAGPRRPRPRPRPPRRSPTRPTRSAGTSATCRSSASRPWAKPRTR